MSEKVWKLLCPVCGRAYASGSWEWILKARPRGVLCVGQGRNVAGRFQEVDSGVDDPAQVDIVMKDPGLFDRLKTRFLSAMSHWLGMGWISIKEILSLPGVRGVAGYPVLTVGPGFSEGRAKRDVLVPIWAGPGDSSQGTLPKRDERMAIWG